MLFNYTRFRIDAFTVFMLFVTFHTGAHAMGNHPQSGQCPADKPYFVFCSHSLHNLEGWHGSCYPTQEEAEKAVTEHAEQEHNGNTRWTGVKQNQIRGY